MRGKWLAHTPHGPIEVTFFGSPQQLVMAVLHGGIWKQVIGTIAEEVLAMESQRIRLEAAEQEEAADASPSPMPILVPVVQGDAQSREEEAALLEDMFALEMAQQAAEEDRRMMELELVLRKLQMERNEIARLESELQDSLCALRVKENHLLTMASAPSDIDKIRDRMRRIQTQDLQALRETRIDVEHQIARITQETSRPKTMAKNRGVFGNPEAAVMVPIGMTEDERRTSQTGSFSGRSAANAEPSSMINPDMVMDMDRIRDRLLEQGEEMKSRLEKRVQVRAMLEAQLTEAHHALASITERIASLHTKTGSDPEDSARLHAMVRQLEMEKEDLVDCVHDLEQQAGKTSMELEQMEDILAMQQLDALSAQYEITKHKWKQAQGALAYAGQSIPGGGAVGDDDEQARAREEEEEAMRENAIAELERDAYAMTLEEQERAADEAREREAAEEAALHTFREQQAVHREREAAEKAVLQTFREQQAENREREAAEKAILQTFREQQAENREREAAEKAMLQTFQEEQAVNREREAAEKVILQLERDAYAMTLEEQERAAAEALEREAAEKARQHFGKNRP